MEGWGGREGGREGREVSIEGTLPHVPHSGIPS